MPGLLESLRNGFGGSSLTVVEIGGQGVGGEDRSFVGLISVVGLKTQQGPALDLQQQSDSPQESVSLIW